MGRGEKKKCGRVAHDSARYDMVCFMRVIRTTACFHVQYCDTEDNTPPREWQTDRVANGRATHTSMEQFLKAAIFGVCVLLVLEIIGSEIFPGGCAILSPACYSYGKCDDKTSSPNLADCGWFALPTLRVIMRLASVEYEPLNRSNSRLAYL